MGPLARLLLGHFHQKVSAQRVPARPTDHFKGNPKGAGRYQSQTGREHAPIQHPCRYRAVGPAVEGGSVAPGG